MRNRSKRGRQNSHFYQDGQYWKNLGGEVKKKITELKKRTGKGKQNEVNGVKKRDF